MFLLSKIPVSEYGTTEWTETFHQYFRPGTEVQVRDFFRGIMGVDDNNPGGSPDGAPLLQFLQVTDSKHFPASAKITDSCSNPDVLAWLGNLSGGWGVMKLCDRAWDVALLSQQTCAGLGSIVSDAMDTFSGILVHEIA